MLEFGSMISEEPFQSYNRHDCPIIGIGASAGGLEAINDTLGSVTEPDRFAYVIVQHLDPSHVSMMAELMDRRTDLDVRQIEGGETLKPGHAYVIPPGKSLKIEDGVLTLESFEEPRGVRRPIDDFFVSLAADQGPNAACIVLSGTGTDGADGLRAIKERGGVAVAQKPNTAKFDGMPVAAISTGLVDFILPPEDIFDRLGAYFDNLREIAESNNPAAFLKDYIDDVCHALKQSVGHDFSGYKRPTLSRRILRRMQVLALDDARDYIKRLGADDRECEALLRDLTINVTSFYRDPFAWETVADVAIPKIVSETNEGDTIRAWVPGCSSGEEAYTLAMLIAEEMSRQKIFRNVQIFATDIDDQMLAMARDGQYSLGSLKTLPKRLLETYIYASEGAFEIMPRIRSMVQFSGHSVIKDPPFSKLDLISCRNLLIYLGDDIQNRLIPLFHYALKPNGFLFLGGSESVGRFEDLFETTHQKARLFSRRPGKALYPMEFPLSRAESQKLRNRKRPGLREKANRFSLADERLLSTYAPQYILINEHGEIIRSSGRLSKFLDFPSGAPTANIKALARKSFRDVLVPLLKSARDAGTRQVVTNVEIKSDFGTQVVDIIVDPLPDHTTLILLPEIEAFRAEFEADVIDAPAEVDRVQDLEEELHLTRFRLRSTVEELETANEELKSSNEEMMSMNEELQSSNEELSTVNEELKTKADQLTFVNADMRHFIDSTELALVVLNEDMAVRTYTESVQDVFPLKKNDKGRPIQEVASLVDDENIIADAKSVLAGGPTVQRLVVRNDGTKSFSMRILPFLSDTDSIEGVTLVFSDVSRLQNAEIALQNQTEKLRLAIDAAGLGVWEYNPDAGSVIIDKKIRELFGIGPDVEASFERIMERIHPDDIDRVNEKLSHAAESGGIFSEEFSVVHPNGQEISLQGVGKIVEAAEGERRMIGVNFDVTTQKDAVHARDLLIREMNHRVKNLFSVVSSMISLAAKADDNSVSVANKIRSQIRALGAAHDVSYNIEVGDEGIALESLLERILSPFTDNNCVDLKGEDISISADALTPLSLILHEWATNALKYGVLSHKEGRLTLTWSRLPGSETEFVLQWNETGTESLSKPDEDALGFGTRLIKLSAQQLGGRVETDWKEKELTHRLIVPVESLSRD